jgi:hypothetical protein
VDVGTGGGIVTLDGYTLREYPYTLGVAGGTTVILEAVPSFGSTFAGWSGDVLPREENPFILMVDCDKNITANFSADWKLFGIGIGCLVLIIALGSVLIIRRREG